MSSNFVIAGMVLAAVAGCASSTTPPVTVNHPAHPDAPATPVAARSTTLASLDKDETGRMKAEPNVTSQPSSSPSAGQLYTCPMHPEVVTADATARCPKCEMKLVPKKDSKPAEAAAGAAHPSDHSVHDAAVPPLKDATTHQHDH